ncbi:Tyrosine-protein kinase [Trema orientale]|uniref:non-specific serine/threonine protein kinase n=1 Tax=Trema orientale TaxID=63057 RepID=A0A2P5BII5_TREOI|nr:Tyrosine-protein kinase [Trema orientale]
MVSSQVACLARNHIEKVLLPAGLPEDFSDIFGPLPGQPSLEAISGDSAVIYSHSQSLLGPITCVNKLVNELTLYETEYDSLEKHTDPASDDDLHPEHQSVGLEDFEVLKVVGQGAFGKVYQVRRSGTSEIYAMKVIRKDKILEKNLAKYVKSERDILAKVNHPFIVQLRYSFQTKYRLYLVLDFINGGHLFFQLYHQGLLREDLARLYTAEIVSAVMLTDFGLAKQFDANNMRSNSVCGTLEYMPPEIVQGRSHDKAADWWCVGILLYEMLTGKPPFTGGNRQKIQEKIVKDKIKLPAFLTSEAHSLLKGFLQKDASRRLGNGPNGSADVKKHKWFYTINWTKLEARKIKPSFLPKVAGKLCVANFEEHWTKMALVESPASSPKFSENPFKRFSYVRTAACPSLKRSVL